MMLAHAERIDADAIGKHRFGDDVAECFCRSAGAAGGINRDVAEGVESEFDMRHENKSIFAPEPAR